VLIVDIVILCIRCALFDFDELWLCSSYPSSMPMVINSAVQ